MKGFLDWTASALVLTMVTLMSLYIFLRMLQGARRELAAKKVKQP